MVSTSLTITTEEIMKKIAIILVAFACASFLTAADFTAQVVSVSGKVEVLNGNLWEKLSVGDTLKSGDTIQSGFRSSAVLKIKDSTVNVDALTRMTVEQLSENSQKDNVRVFVKTGGIKSDVQKTNGKKVGFTVRTPVATASVRGTEFSVQNTFNSTQVNTTRGKVAVWSGNNSERISSDENPANENSVDDENDKSEKNPQNESEHFDNSFENAPHGALTVSQGQGSEFGSGGNIGSQRNSAENSTNGDIGRGTSFQSDMERGMQKTDEIGKRERNSSSSLIVNVTVED